VKIDDMLVKTAGPGRLARLSQSELECLAVAQRQASSGLPMPLAVYKRRIENQGGAPMSSRCCALALAVLVWWDK
jgi:hypothetical protein